MADEERFTLADIDALRESISLGISAEEYCRQLLASRVELEDRMNATWPPADETASQLETRRERRRRLGQVNHSRALAARLPLTESDLTMIPPQTRRAILESFDRWRDGHVPYARGYVMGAVYPQADFTPLFGPDY